MAVIGESQSGAQQIDMSSSDLTGGVAGAHALGINTSNGKLFYRTAGNTWDPYEDAVVLRSTGVGATDTANLLAAVGASSKILIDDRDGPLVLDQGGIINLGDVFLRARSGMARISLSNNTQILFGDFINVASHSTWDACTVSTDKDVVTSATLANPEPGDVLIVVSEDLITGINPHNSGGTQRPCELALIERVSGSSIYLSTPLVDTYTSTPRCALMKLSGVGGVNPLATRSGMANIEFSGSKNSSVGSNSTGIFACAVYRPIFENIIMRDCGAFYIQTHLHAQMRGITVDSQTSGALDYGIAIGVGDDMIIDGLITHRCRHGVTTGGQGSGLDRYGTMRRNIIRNSKMFTSGIDVGVAQSTFTANATTNELTLANPIFAIGNYVRFTTTGTLPSPLAINTNYFVKSQSGTTLTVTATQNGSTVDITTTGSGTHTITRSFSTSSLATTTSNIAFDVHAEGYETSFENCTAILTGPSNLAGTQGSQIGFSSRARRTVYRNCIVYGDSTSNHRGFFLESSPDVSYYNCTVINGGCGFHTTAHSSTAPGSNGVQIRGGLVRGVACDAVVMDGGIGNVIDGLVCENVGSQTGFGGTRACITFLDTDGVGYGFHIVRNCHLQKGTNLYSVGIGTLDASTLILENNDCSGYDNCELGLNRALSGALGLELKYGRKQRYRLDVSIVQQTAHGLTTSDLWAPITTAHDRYDDTAAGQEVAGILVDVIDANSYCLIGKGKLIEVPDSVLGGSYSIAGDGRSLWWDDSASDWIPDPPAGSDGSTRPMLYVTAYLNSTLYCRVGTTADHTF